MSKLEYLNPSDWSLHVIDGENEGVPEGWVWVPSGADKLIQAEDGIKTFWINGKQYHLDGTLTGHGKDGLLFSDWCSMWDYKLLWSRKMKEYLVERDGKYELIEAYHLDGGIEIPEGAIAATVNGKADDLLFWREHETHYCFNPEDTDGWFVGADKLKEYLSYWSDSKIIWQRNPSLKDQYAGIEKVRQVELKDVRARADIFCKETSKHRHYFKNVQNLNIIDVYRVLELFDVQSHAVGHAVKKLLCSGGRGSKDYLQDIQEAIDSLQREIEMKKEDSK